jgi:hypothetical protein
MNNELTHEEKVSEICALWYDGYIELAYCLARYYRIVVELH